MSATRQFQVVFKGDPGSLNSAVSSITSNMSALGRAMEGISGKFSGLGSGIAGAFGKISNLAGNVSNLAGGFGALKGALTGITTGFFGANAAMEQQQVAFEQLLGSADEATNLMQELEQFSASTPFEFPQLVDLTTKLLGVGKEAKDVIPWMTAVGDAASGVGKGVEGIYRINTALTQMELKGRITGEEMAQLAETGINGWKILSEATGKTTAELQEMNERGLLPATEYVPLLVEGLGNLYSGQMESQSRTFNGLMSTLRDNIGMALREISGPAFERAKSALVRLGEIVSDPRFKEMAANIGEGVGQAFDRVIDFVGRLEGPLTRLINWFQDLSPQIQRAVFVFSGFIAAAIPLAPIIIGISGALGVLLSPIGLVVIGIAALVAAGVTLYQNWDTIIERFPIVESGFRGLLFAVGALGKIGVEVFTTFLNIVKIWAGGLADIFGGVLTGLKEVGLTLVSILDPREWDNIDDHAKAAAEAFSGVFSTAGEAAILTAQEVAFGFFDTIDAIVNDSDWLADMYDKAMDVDAQERLKQANEDLTRGYELMYLEMGANAGQMATLTEVAEEQIDAFGRLAEVQGLIDDQISRTSGAISHWESTAGDVEKALGYLNDQIASGIPLSKEQQEQYDRLTWYQDRIANGIASDLVPAYIDAVDAEAKYTKTVDELNQALEDGMPIEEHARLVAEATEEYKSALDPQQRLALSNEQLADSMDGVTERMVRLLETLGIIDSTEAEFILGADDAPAAESVSNVTASIEDYEAMNPNVELTADDSAARKIADEAALYIADPNRSKAVWTLGLDKSEFDAAMQAATSTLVGGGTGAGDSSGAAPLGHFDESGGVTGVRYLSLDSNAFQQRLVTAQQELHALQSNTYYTTLDIDLSRFYAALETARRLLPSSPAKEGPLAFTPDWSSYFEGLATEAETYTQQATETVRKGLTTIQLTDNIRNEGSDSSRHDDTSGLVDSIYDPFTSYYIVDLAEQFADNVEKALPQIKNSGEEIANAMLQGMTEAEDATARVGEFVGLITDDVASALAAKRSELEESLSLARIVGDPEEIAKIEEQLAHIQTLLTEWANATGQSVEDVLASPDFTTRLTEHWMGWLGNLDEIVSGDFQQRLADEISDLKDQYAVALALDAPQEVLDALIAMIQQKELELAEAGVIAGAAVGEGIVAGLEPTGDAIADLLSGAISPENWQTAADDINDILSGDALTDLQHKLQETVDQIAFLELIGAPQEVIDAAREQQDAIKAEIEEITAMMVAAAEAGMLDPETLRSFMESIGHVFNLPVEQLLATADQMEDGGKSLLKDFVAAVAGGTAELDDVMALLGEIVEQAMEDSEGEIVDAVAVQVDALEELRQKLLDDLAQAYIDGTDPSAILANLAVVDAALAETTAGVAELSSEVLALQGLGNLSDSPTLASGGSGGGTGAGRAGGDTAAGGDFLQSIDQLLSEINASGIDLGDDAEAWLQTVANATSDGVVHSSVANQYLEELRDLQEQVRDALVDDWTEALSHIGESGEYITDLQNQIAHLQAQLLVAQESGAPEAVLEKLTEQIELTKNQLGIAQQIAANTGETAQAITNIGAGGGGGGNYTAPGSSPGNPDYTILPDDLPGGKDPYGRFVKLNPEEHMTAGGYVFVGCSVVTPGVSLWEHPETGERRAVMGHYLCVPGKNADMDAVNFLLKQKKEYNDKVREKMRAEEDALAAKEAEKTARDAQSDVSEGLTDFQKAILEKMFGPRFAQMGQNLPFTNLPQNPIFNLDLTVDGERLAGATKRRMMDGRRVRAHLARTFR